MTAPADMTDAELTVHVAVSVMGWKQAYLWQRKEGEPFVAVGRDVQGWSPTTDANAMMEVVERMRELGWKYNATDTPSRPALPGHHVAFFRELGRTDAYARHMNLGRAICEAALEAVSAK